MLVAGVAVWVGAISTGMDNGCRWVDFFALKGGMSRDAGSMVRRSHPLVSLLADPLLRCQISCPALYDGTAGHGGAWCGTRSRLRMSGAIRVAWRGVALCRDVGVLVADMNVRVRRPSIYRCISVSSNDQRTDIGHREQPSETQDAMAVHPLDAPLQVFERYERPLFLCREPLNRRVV